jgi:hypothetical protein
MNMRKISVSVRILRAGVHLGVLGMLLAASPIGCGDDALGSNRPEFTDAGSRPNRGTGAMSPDPFFGTSVATVPPVGAWDLPFNVVDAAYSNALERIVIASDLPQAALYLFDPSSLRAVQIALPKAPRRVSVSPDGLSAAIGHDGEVSWVDLAAMSIKKRCYVGPEISAVALANDGRAYASGSAEGVRGTDLRACTDQSAEELDTPSHPGLAIDGERDLLYAAPNDSSDMDIRVYDISEGKPRAMGALGYQHHILDCGALWRAADGRIFLRCGDVIENGSIRPLGLPFEEIRAVAARSGAALIVPEPPLYGPTQVSASAAYFYDASWKAVGKIELSANGENNPSNIRHAFARAGSGEWYVIAERPADPPSFAMSVIASP